MITDGLAAVFCSAVGLLLVRSRSGHADQGDAAQCHRSGEQRD